MNMVIGFALGFFLACFPALVALVGTLLMRWWERRQKDQVLEKTSVLTDGWTFATPEALRVDYLVSGVGVTIEDITDHPELKPATLRDVSVRVSTMLYLGYPERQVRDFLSKLCHSVGDTPLVANRDFMVIYGEEVTSGTERR